MQRDEYTNTVLPGIYRGWVRHRRLKPKPHDFRYPLAMVMFDLDDLDSTFSKSKLWSLEKLNFISFKHKDYIQEESSSEKNIKVAVKQKIKQQTGQDFDGRIMLLTHPRYFGFVMNPVSFYFCYSGDELLHIVSEINNTPWDERFSYVLNPSCSDTKTGQHSFDFDKQFHVSPFMPMGMQYRWRFSFQPHKVNIHMTLMEHGEKVFDATMQGEQQPFTATSMRSLPFAYPLQTVLVAWRIYWHALLLYIKGIRFHTHPNNVKNNN